MRGLHIDDDFEPDFDAEKAWYEHMNALEVEEAERQLAQDDFDRERMTEEEWFQCKS